MYWYLDRVHGASKRLPHLLPLVVQLEYAPNTGSRASKASFPFPRLAALADAAEAVGLRMIVEHVAQHV